MNPAPDPEQAQAAIEYCYAQGWSDGDEKSDHFVGLCYADYVAAGGVIAAGELEQAEDSLSREVHVQNDAADDLIKRVLAGEREALHQHLGDEGLRRERRQRLVEGHDQHAVEAGRGEEAQLRLRVGEPEQRLVGAQHQPRVRLEGDGRRRALEAVRALERRRHHRLVAAVDAVEIADRDDRPEQPVEAGRVEPGRAVAHHDEGARWFGENGHGEAVMQSASMIPKSGYRFSDKIMLQEEAKAG